mgnify:CR=1 FL=1
MPEDIISSQINYKQMNQYQPRYKYVRINMSNILSNKVPVTATGTAQVQFKLPYNTVYNLAKSKIATLIPVQAQTGVANNAGCARVVADCWPFGNQSVSFETGNGLQLLNLNESSKFTKIVTKYNTSLRNFLTKDVTDFPNVTPTATNPTPAGTAMSGASGTEARYYIQTPAATGTTTAALTVPIMYELANFKHTILACDKDLYFGANDMYLKYTIGGVDNFAYTSASVTDPRTPASLSVAIGNLENVYLWLAVEQDTEIIQNIVSKYNSSGINLLIDYPIITKSTSTPSTNQAIVVPFVPANGKFLKRIYHTVWRLPETTSTLLDCENSAGVRKITSYNSYLDSMKLQDDLIKCATAVSTTEINQDDWRINQQFCRDSVIQNYIQYQKNWAQIDDFCNPDQEKDHPDLQQNTKDGLPMTHGLQYQFIATAATETSYIHLNIGVFQREVYINPSGVQFV